MDRGISCSDFYMQELCENSRRCHKLADATAAAEAAAAEPAAPSNAEPSQRRPSVRPPLTATPEAA
jgi:hypothetical protein